MFKSQHIDESSAVGISFNFIVALGLDVKKEGWEIGFGRLSHPAPPILDSRKIIVQQRKIYFGLNRVY